MPARRLEPIRDRVRLEVDGERVDAERGEPIAVAIAAAGRLVLGRSVKYHRPRGAACYAGRCDGCLMRVGGQQSVMTCRTPATDGLVVETQNVIGTAEHDLLAAADWFYPRGMNHHEMFTWNPQVNRVMQKVARRVAGVGRLPDRAAPLMDATEHEVDVLVVGGGPAGLCAATACARSGLRVALVDEEECAGGSLRLWPGTVEHAGKVVRGPELAASLVEQASAAGVEIASRASAVGIYDPWEDAGGVAEVPATPGPRTRPPLVVVDDPERLHRYHPRRIVIATGRNEGASAFADNDKPGVVTVRGALTLLAHGVLVGERVVLAGEGPAIEALAAALKKAKADIIGPVPEASVRRARGRPTVTSCELERNGSIERHACDAIVVAAPSSAVFELAAQAGVRVMWSGTGYELDTSPEDGRTAAPDVRVVGGAAGITTLEEALAQAARAARAIAEELAA